MSALRIAVERVGHLLPAQGPISVFIHHNVLHAFERRRFEEAVVEAARIYGAQPFWPADRYRALFDEGRMTNADLREVIDEALGPSAAHRDLLFAATRYGVPDLRGPPLDWHLYEDDGLRCFRKDLPPAARAAIAATGARDPDDVARVVRGLWDACVGAIGRAPRPDAPRVERASRRHRDVVLATLGIDIDDDVHPLLVRFLSGYLDQGLALWPMPDRHDGLYVSFVHMYRARWLAPFIGRWGRQLVELVDDDVVASRDAYASLEASLRALGVTADEQEAYLLDTALALKGWAGMARQIEQRPDRVPVWPVPASLVDVLAVRLLVERAVLAHATPLRLDTLRRDLASRLPEAEVERTEDRAFQLFHVAQLLGIDAMHVDRLSADEVAAIEGTLRVHRAEQERLWLHASFELQLRKRFLDAISGHRPEPNPRPRMQAIFCVDERMESIRRHLEEVDERIETLSTAGFFGVAIYFQGARDARPRPLAPVAMKPRHFIPAELREEGVAEHFAREIDKLRGQAIHVGSRSLLRGAIVSVAGAASLVPLVLRVLFPHRLGASVIRPRPQGRMLIDRVPRVTPTVGEWTGYSTDEMVAIVERVLTEVGLGTGSFGRLVVIVGHAADSLNNPHRSAYDCGACGGGPGGANARAFVAMANRATVRQRLADRNLVIPERTHFLAAELNTTDDSVTFFDEAEIPPSHADDLVHARATFDEARRRNAEERLRRFARSAAPAPTGDDALDAVRARRWDLAEPRPEYNHATNAVCVIGRRARTRGLFLDRRAFLVSYDPTRDDASCSTLRAILDAVVPVVLGINLEYFFGAIDNDVYGAGSKLPHNVAALIGVMNGAQGDLRAGLWSQTVEIHEPVRLTVVIEAAPERLRALLEGSPNLARLVRNRWLFLAALSPDAPEVHEFIGEETRVHAPAQSLAVVPGPSANWFRGKRGHLGFVQIAPDPTL